MPNPREGDEQGEGEVGSKERDKSAGKGSQSVRAGLPDSQGRPGRGQQQGACVSGLPGRPLE